ncbi:MAG: aminotransferase, partial [Clostridia bacterium]|nr:aminotransferase [Clostridia bacterium]
RWNSPKGGYFISLYVLDGCAKRVEQLCANAGLILTPAGAAYPYGKDPKDSNLRIAPTYPSAEEIATAAKVLCVAIKYAALEKLMENA